MSAAPIIDLEGNLTLPPAPPSNNQQDDGVKYTSEATSDRIRGFEVDRDRLFEQQMPLFGKYMDFMTLFINTTAVFVAMMAGGVFIGFYLHNRTHAYVVTIMVLITFVLGVASVMCLVRKLVKDIDWLASQLRIEIRTLKDTVEGEGVTSVVRVNGEVLPRLLDVLARKEKILDSLKESSTKFYWKFIWGVVGASFLFIVAIALWINFTFRVPAKT